MSKKLTTLLGAALLLATTLSSTVAAHEKGDWLLRFGGSVVDPKSNNHPVVSVDSAASFTFARMTAR